MFDGKFKASISLKPDGVGDIDMNVRGSATMTQRDVLVSLLMPICDSILAVHNCGCEICKNQGNLASELKAVLDRHYALAGIGTQIDTEKQFPDAAPSGKKARMH